MHPSSVRVKKPISVMAGSEPTWLRWLLIDATYAIIGGLILVPIAYVFVQALSEGWGVYWDNLWRDPDTRHSIWLTLSARTAASEL